MHVRAIGALVVIATLVLVAAWVLVDQFLLVREHTAGVVTLSPGQSFSFSFDVFPLGSDVQYSFVAQAGPEGGVEIQSTNPNGTYIFSITPVYGRNNMYAGTYHATIYASIFSGAEANSTIDYHVTSVGYPNGSSGASLYAAFPVVVIVSPTALIGGTLLILNWTRTQAPAYCPYCGKTSGESRCHHCGLPRSITWGRMR